jgi:hypothetical protein
MNLNAQCLTIYFSQIRNNAALSPHVREDLVVLQFEDSKLASAHQFLHNELNR